MTKVALRKPRPLRRRRLLIAGGAALIFVIVAVLLFRQWNASTTEQLAGEARTALAGKNWQQARELAESALSLDADHVPALMAAAEAAANLGASRWRAFRDVTVPLTLPGILTGCIFVFVPSLGNFVIPELLGGGKTVMVGNLIRDQFLKARDWPFGSVLALSVIVFLVVLFLLQAWVTRRVNEGSRRA